MAGFSGTNAALCPAGGYCPAGSVTPLLCPSGTTSPPGAQFATDCTAVAGYWGTPGRSVLFCSSPAASCRCDRFLRTSSLP